MKAKLTLSIEETTKENAKRYAKQHQTSISQMVEEFLEAVSKNELDDEKEDWKPEKGSAVSEMLGSVPDIDNKDYKEIIVEERAKKYKAHSN